MSAEAIDARHVGADGPILEHPTVELMAARFAAGSRRDDRQDGHVVALAIEGGAIAGVVSAGMCVLLEATSLIDTVDQIYGTSSGALNGVYTAAGRGAVGATNYRDIMIPGFATPRNWLRRKSLIDFKYLFDDVIAEQKPVTLEDLKDGPEFAAVGVNLATAEPEVFRDFESTRDLMRAVRASCAMPFLSGRPARYRGMRLTDGAMRASVPFKPALKGGASHVLALRTRAASYRKEPYKKHEIYLPALAGGLALTRLVKERPALYNAEAEALQTGEFPSVAQLAPAGPEEEPVAQLEKSVARMQEGFRLGAMAAAKAFGLPELTVDWETFPPRLLADRAA